MAKLKLASYWAAACGGCDVAILDIHEKILDLAAAADIVFWPIATDFKYSDVEAMPDEYIDVTLFHGAVRNSENEHLARLLRAKSKVLVAFGSCAHIGGIPDWRTCLPKRKFRRAHHETPSIRILTTSLSWLAEAEER
jgi:F420-non-reducing hydrogenase small subunit